MNASLVSVLMTAYNRERYIAEAIESVLASSLGDFELIIVDDGSTDGTVDIARRYGSDGRVKVFVNPTNLGDYPNRNHAASLASGKYMKYLDSDDAIYPHGLEVMVRAMEKFPDAALGIMRPPAPDAIYPLCVSPAAAYREHFLGQGFLDYGPVGVILRTDAFREAGGFSGLRYVGDTEMWLKLAAVHPTVKLTEGLAWWRSHGEQEFALGHRSTDYVRWNYTVACAALNSPLCPLEKAEREQALQQSKRRQCRFILRTLSQCHVVEATQIKLAAGFGWLEVARCAK